MSKSILFGLVIIVVLVCVYASMEHFPTPLTWSWLVAHPYSGSVVSYPLPLREGLIVHSSDDNRVCLIRGGKVHHFSPDGYAAAGRPSLTNVSGPIVRSLPAGPPILA
jgi:hypothetical protein